MNPIKCDEDIPSVLHLPIPFVVMRQNVDVKMHLHRRKQYFALIRCVLAGLFLIGLADLLMTQKVFFFILLSFLVVCCSSVLSSYEASIKQKQHLAMTQRLPNIVPFLHIDGQRLCLYDCYGYQAIEVPLASFRAMHLKKVRCGNCWLEISYFNQSSKKLVIYWRPKAWFIILNIKQIAIRSMIFLGLSITSLICFAKTLLLNIFPFKRKITPKSNYGIAPKFLPMANNLC